MIKTKELSKQTAVITPRQKLFIGVEIQGLQMLQNNFDQKTIEQMLRKHMGLNVEKEKKIPSDCIERAIIRNTEEAICIKPIAIKKAMLSAATLVKGLTTTKLRKSIFIDGHSIPISYSRMLPQMDFVRTAGINKAPDIRFRPRFEDWSARFIILFSDLIPIQTIIDLLDRAGDIGVAEWRPEKDGDYGTFEIKRLLEKPKEIEEVRRICRPPVKPFIIPDWAMNVEMTPELLEKLRRKEK